MLPLVSHGEYADGIDGRTDRRQTVTLRFPLDAASANINNRIVCKPDTHLRGFWIILGPDTNVLVEVVRTEDRRISSQVIEVVHDDCHEQIQHLLNSNIRRNRRITSGQKC